MKLHRTIPPAAAMIGFADLLYGTAGFIYGKRYLRELEEGIKSYFGVRHVFLVSSGKAALTIILRALHSLSPDRDEVLIPAYTCYSVPSAIMKAGLAVSLCDIDPQTFDYDHAALDREISERTLCVVPTHLFGIPSDVEKVKSLCRRKSVFVVEDAAQAMGGSVGGNKLGTMGDAGFFSLGRGKNITCGSGGIVLTNDGRIAEAIMKEYAMLERPGAGEDWSALIVQLAMKIFLHPNLYWLPAGIPALKLGQTIFHRDFPVKKMSGIKAGLLKHWRKRLDASNSIRRNNVNFYAGGPGRSQDPTLPLIRMPIVAENREERDRIYDESRRNGLGISLMYPTAINQIREIADLLNGKEYPSAALIAECLTAAPTHHLLSMSDKTKIRQMVSSQALTKITGNAAVQVAG